MSNPISDDFSTSYMHLNILNHFLVIDVFEVKRWNFIKISFIFLFKLNINSFDVFLLIRRGLC